MRKKLKIKNFKLSTRIIEHIARLANLKLTQEEIKKFQSQLSEILNYVRQLEEVKTENIEPTSQVTGLENVFREDKINSSLTPKEILSGNKNNTQGMFKIPSIF